MLRIIQGEKPETEKRTGFDPEFDQCLETEELENAQAFRFKQLSFKQKIRELRGQNVDQWHRDIMAMAYDFYGEYKEYEACQPHLTIVSENFETGSGED